jgi:hypothetical protein
MALYIEIYKTKTKINMKNTEYLELLRAQNGHLRGETPESLYQKLIKGENVYLINEKGRRFEVKSLIINDLYRVGLRIFRNDKNVYTQAMTYSQIKNYFEEYIPLN